jgi:UDP-N-acetylglucosamine 1-carboxyvinyltransferase
MQKYMIVGGNRLQGTVKASGSKNASLPILAACLLGSGHSIIHSVPDLTDVSVMMEVLHSLGAGVRREGSTVHVDAEKIESFEVSEDLMRKMRASNLVLGPMLARFKKVTISHPGG